MESTNSAKDTLLLDADMVFHFLFADELELLPKIFHNKHLVLIDLVYEELTVADRIKKKIDKFIASGEVELIDFPDDPAVRRAYAELRRDNKGKGESACMAVAFHFGYHIGSCNWADILDFCNRHKIKHYSTLDCLYMAYKNGILSVQQCEYFITAVKGKNGKIKFTMQQYIDKVKAGHRAEIHQAT